MPLTTVVPLPSNPINSDSDEYRRLWMGNLDLRITEFQLVKLLQKYGKIEKFDMIYHKAGPSVGQPRGYAFVTYSNDNEAKKMKLEADGLKIGCKTVSIKWANKLNQDDLKDKVKHELTIPALVGAKDPDKKMTKDAKIRAIEAKLRLMQQTSRTELEITNKPILASITATSATALPNNSKQNVNLRIVNFRTFKNNKYNQKPYRRK